MGLQGKGKKKWVIHSITLIFSEIKNKIQSGNSLRDALEKVDQLRFRSQDVKHELSHLYEVKIKNMGNAGRNGGEYYIMSSSFFYNECHLHKAA